MEEPGMLKRFIKYYLPHRKLFALDMAASLLVSLIGVVYPIITRTMLNDLIPNRKRQMIVIAALTLLVLYVVRMLLNYFIQYQGHIMGVKMQAHMRSDMFRHLEKLPFSFYDSHETGKIMSRMTTDLNDISELAHHGPENIIIASISVVIAFVYLSTINLWLTLIIFSCVPLLMVASAKIRKNMHAAYLKSKIAISAINASLQSSIAGIRVTKAFTNSKKEEEKFSKSNGQFVEASRDQYKTMGQFHASTTFITDFFNVVVLLSGGLFLYNGKITFADYSAFILSINLFLNPITMLIRFMEQYQSGSSGFERFLEIMDTEPEMDRTHAVDVPRMDGHIRFENVSYHYETGNDVIRNLDLDIPCGKTFALVGPSGGGKTTICHLIPHFYDIQSGVIRIDGKDICDITLESLRRNIGIVQQDIYLFNSSIRDNILYGRLDASDEEVIEAAKRANIHDYVMTLPDGYDTIVGERGIKLSGGQKQRLCIARVFLKNPPILILDEATSALDNTTEIQIQQALDELCKGRTTLVVAHRLSTIKRADEIAVIADGQVVERGTHEALMEQNGMYADLYNLQFKQSANV